MEHGSLQGVARVRRDGSVGGGLIVATTLGAFCVTPYALVRGTHQEPLPLQAVAAPRPPAQATA
jgi:hypothetical protein